MCAILIGTQFSLIKPAIEDTEESSNSAVNAGIKCIGFPGNYHVEDNFQMCIKKMNLLDQSIFSL